MRDCKVGMIVGVSFVKWPKGDQGFHDCRYRIIALDPKHSECTLVQVKQPAHGLFAARQRLIACARIFRWSYVRQWRKERRAARASAKAENERRTAERAALAAEWEPRQAIIGDILETLGVDPNVFQYRRTRTGRFFDPPTAIIPLTVKDFWEKIVPALKPEARGGA